MKYLLILVAIHTSLHSYSQSEGKSENLEDAISKNDTAVVNTYLSQKSFNKKLMLVFGQLATGQQSASVLTNYADADILNGKISFNGTAALGKQGRHFLSIGASGKINNSVADLFNGFKLNNNTSVDVRLHNRLFTRFYYQEKDAIELRQNIRHLASRRHYNDIAAGYDSIATVAFINREASIRKALGDSLRRLRQIVNDAATGAPGNTANQPSIDLLRQRFYTLLLDSISSKRRSDSANLIYTTPKRFENLRKKNKEEMEAKVEELELAAPFSSIHLVWFTLRINPFRQKFYLYDSLQSFSSQLNDSLFTSAYYGGELSYYYWSNHRSFSVYANIGGGYQKENNLDSLDTYEVVDTREEEVGSQNRKVSSKYSSYLGDYREFSSWRIYANLYIFSKNNKAAIHVFPELRLWENGPTIFNTGIGFVMSFKSKKEEKTIINAEPYIQWLDLSNQLKSGIRDNFRKNQIGIRVGLPINPNVMGKE